MDRFCDKSLVASQRAVVDGVTVTRRLFISGWSLCALKSAAPISTFISGM